MQFFMYHRIEASLKKMFVSMGIIGMCEDGKSLGNI